MNFLFNKYPFDFSENLFIPEVFLLSGGAGTGRDTGSASFAEGVVDLGNALFLVVGDGREGTQANTDLASGAEFLVDEGHHGNSLADGNPDRGLGPEMEFAVNDLPAVQILDRDGLGRAEKGAGRTSDTGFRLFAEGSADDPVRLILFPDDGIRDLLFGRQMGLEGFLPNPISHNPQLQLFDP